MFVLADAMMWPEAFAIVGSALASAFVLWWATR